MLYRIVVMVGAGLMVGALAGCVDPGYGYNGTGGYPGYYQQPSFFNFGFGDDDREHHHHHHHHDWDDRD
ncbi:MAG: hypothetical protein M3Y22_14480 [Pseudomonadota bacterium]|nr:hypothetical protein [Pseudomonadota bacterium]